MYKDEITTLRKSLGMIDLVKILKQAIYFFICFIRIMKILPYVSKGIKINSANRFNLCFSNALTSDTFERRNITFEGKDKKLQRACKGNSELIKILNELIDTGISTDKAISYLDFIKSNIEKLDKLSKDSELNIMDKIGLIAYEIDDVERYKELKKSFEQHEALLATKFGLDDNQIQTYLSKKGQVINYQENNDARQYIMSEDELMLCVKEGFDEAQIERFAQLRNRTRNLENNTVRKQGGEQQYPISYIITAVKEKKTDEDIEREDRIINMKKLLGELPVDIMAKIICLSNDEYSQFKIIVSDTKDIKLALKLAALTEEQHRTYTEVLPQVQNEYQALNFAQLTEEQRKNLIEFTPDEINLYCDPLHCSPVDLAKLTKKQYQRFQICISIGWLNYEALSFAQLTDEQLKRCMELVTKDITFLFKDKLTIAKYARLTDEQYKRALKMASTYEEFKNWPFPVIESEVLKLAQLTEEQYERYKKILYEGESKEDALILAMLTKEQQKRYEELISEGEIKTLALRKAQTEKKQFKMYEELTEKQQSICKKLVALGEIEGHAINIAQLTPDQYQRYKKIPIRVSEEQAFQIAKTTNLVSVTPEIISKFSDDFWYMTTTGCSEKDYENIKKAINLVLSNTQDENMQLTPLNKLGADLPYEKDEEYTFDKNTGEFELKTSNPFSTKLSQGIIEQKPFLVIQDKNSQNQYISYNGAIAQVKPLQDRDSEQFKTWGNLLPQKQAEILAKAADAFVFNLFDEEGNCIIGQDAPDFNVNKKADYEIEQYYSQKLIDLKNNNELTAQNILKLMPEDCMLAIYPYIQDGKMLYSIVVEWFSSDGNRWQMEVHSQNLEHNNDEKWIFRLHKEDNTGRHYFQFDENGNCNFNGAYTGGGSINSHIEIPSPLEDNNLLNNVDFQKIIKEISSKLSKDYEINEIARKLGVQINPNNTIITAKNIITHCLKNPVDFAMYRNEILSLRKSFGMINLV